MSSTMRDPERWLAEAQRLAHIGSWLWDIRSNALEWSDELYRIFGLRPQELEATFEGFLSHVHADDRARVQSEVDQALAGHPYSSELRVVRPDGTTRWTLAHGEVVRAADGAAIAMLGTAQDITEARESEASLADANARMHLLQVIAVAANDATDVEAALQTALEVICRFTGWPVGHAWLRANGELRPTGLWHADEAGARAACERVTRARSRDDPGLPLRVVEARRPAWVPVAEGRGDGEVPSARDLGRGGGFAVPVMVGREVAAVLEFFSAEIVEPDAGLLDLMMQVGTQLGRVIERAQAVEALAGARDAAMESDRAKSQFLANMSHEIRTPMNGVIGMIDLLLQTELTAEQRQLAETAGSSGEALLAIISDILDLSKLDAGMLSIAPDRFDVPGTVADVCELLSRQAHDKGLELSFLVDDDVPVTAWGDRHRVRQVLINLVSNAIKFTDRGEVLLTVGRAGPPNDPDVLCFAVTDSGVGIEPAAIAGLFDAFAQADASATRRFGGTGLGLTISRQLARMMGGDVRATSSPGRGSTFSLTARLPAAGDAPPPAGSGELAGLRVLVVDDNATSRHVLERQLTPWGIEATLVDGGPAALAALQAAVRDATPFALALIDVDMPGMTGLQLAGAITADPRTADIPLIALTSSGTLHGQIGGLGIRASLTKPVRPARLSDAICAVVRRDAADPPTAQAPAAAPIDQAGRGVILVAEDNPVNREVIVLNLRRRGLAVVVAENGRETVERSARSAFDAIFMDCQMPVLDGYAATAEIRARERADRRAGHIPIIAMTAHAMAGAREECLLAGMDDYVAKPVRADELDRALDRWVPGPVAAASPHRAPPPPQAMSDGGRVIDPDRISALRQTCGTPAAAAELVSLFVAQTRTQLDAIARAAADDDALVSRLLHTLAGSAATVGACELEARCRSALAGGHPPDADALRTAFERARLALERELVP